jgi:hypothetical protein
LGLAYTFWVSVQAKRITTYTDYFSDWVWRSGLPALGYAGVLVAGPLLFADVDLALDIVGAASLVLLFAGLHNAWDTAVWIATGHE